VEFTSLEQYKHAIEEEFYVPSFYVLCTASAVEQLEGYLLTYQKKNRGACPQIICFDTKENVMMVRKKHMFVRNSIFAMANSNIKEIIEDIKKQPRESLVTGNVYTTRQMKAYSEIKDTFVELKSHFFRYETSAFHTMDYESLYR